MSSNLKLKDINDIIALIQTNVFVNASAPVKRRRHITVATNKTDYGYGGYLALRANLYGKRTVA